MNLRDLVQSREHDQIRRQAAKDIYRDVRRWQNEPQIAPLRWFWELTQNAVDSATQSQRSASVSCRIRGRLFEFEHFGGPFTLDDLAALITGGSAKPYGSPHLTGQFGTGFLVTHFLSLTVDLTGIAVDDNGKHYKFGLTIRRSGSESDIEANIDACYRQLEEAALLTEIPEESSRAKFTYVLPSDDIRISVQATLRRVGPLLCYTLCFAPHLKSIEIGIDQESHRWSLIGTPSPVQDYSSGNLLKHEIRIEGTGQREPRYLDIFEVRGRASCAVACELLEGRYILRPLGDGYPKLFRTYPLIGARMSSLPVVINATSFYPKEDRTDLFLDATDKPETVENRKVLGFALESLPALVEYAAQRKWQGAERLALLPHDLSKDPSKEWWASVFLNVAESVGRKAVLRLADGRVVAPLDSKIQPVFPAPRLRASDPLKTIPLESVWRLAHALWNEVPALDISELWDQIVLAWRSLGLKGETQFGVDELRRHVAKLGSVRDLAGAIKAEDEAALAWLRELITILSSYEISHGDIPSSLLDGILPDQAGTFKPPNEVHQDPGIDEDLKRISFMLGSDLRKHLIDRRLCANNAALTAFLSKHVPRTISQDQVIEHLIAELQKRMPKGEKGKSDDLVTASVRIVGWLCNRNAQDDSTRAKRCPYVTLHNEIVMYSSPGPVALPPPSKWPEGAREFCGVFPANRVLTEAYATLSGSNQIFERLQEWGIIHSDVVIHRKSERLETKLAAAVLAQMAGHETAHSVREIDVTDIAFLNDLTGAASADSARANSLLRFLLEYVIDADESWLSVRTAPCSMPGHSHTIHIYPSRWLAHLRTVRWVPSLDEGETAEHRQLLATSESLKDLITWETALRSPHAVEFLVRFGFDALDLTIRRHATPQTYEGVRGALATVVETIGGHPEDYNELLRLVQEQAELRSQIHRNQSLGRRVEGCVLEAFKNQGFDTIPQAWGYDFTVLVKERYDAIDAEAGTIDLAKISLGPFLVEVKATTTDEARLSPLQAEFAIKNPDTYLVCVVDLKGSQVVSAEDIADEQIVRAIRIVGDLAPTLTPVFVERRDTEHVRLDNAGKLRYCLRRQLWVSGEGLSNWVKKISDELQRRFPLN